MDLGLVGRAAAAPTELPGRPLIAGRCAQRLGHSGDLSIPCSGAAAPARGADHKNLELPLLISFSGFALGAGAMQLEDGPRSGGSIGRASCRGSGENLERGAL